MDDADMCKCGLHFATHHKYSDMQGCGAFVPMTCAKCGKKLRMTLCKYDKDRHYYCVEHCPEHVWQSDYDWPTECMHCGIHEDDFLRSEVTRLKKELSMAILELAKAQQRNHELESELKGKYIPSPR